jgi:hypothetical protein
MAVILLVGPHCMLATETLMIARHEASRSVAIPERTWLDTRKIRAADN